jgi:hypothetical protein
MQKSCQEEADMDRQRYKAELAAWKATNPGAGLSQAKVKPTKKPHSAYILFLKDFQCVPHGSPSALTGCSSCCICSPANCLENLKELFENS